MSSQSRATQPKQGKQVSLAAWLQKIQRPPYPKAPPLPAEFAANTLGISDVPSFNPSINTSTISPPPLRQRASLSIAKTPEPMPATARSSVKRKRGPSETPNSPVPPLAFRPSPAKSKAADCVDHDAPKSSGLSMASHTPPESSSPTSSVTGLTLKKPITISSSSPGISASQNRSFVVQSSQSDERAESEDELDGDTIVVQSSRTKDKSAAKTKSQTSSDDEKSDSDLESLPDMTTLLHKKLQSSKLQKLNRPLTPPTTGSAGRNKRGATFKGSYNVPQTFENILSKSNPSDHSPLQPGFVPKRSFNLSKLVRLAEKDERREFARDEAEAAIFEEDEDLSNEDTNLSASMLANFMKGSEEEDNLERLAHAMDRTEVMKGSTEWHFFDHDTAGLDDEPMPKFPRLENEEAGWASMQDAAFREHALLTCFVPQTLQPASLSEKSRERVMRWLWSAASLEPRENLAQAYSTTLKTWRRAEQSPTRFQSLHVRSMFQRSGAKCLSLEEEQAMKPSSMMAPTTPLSRPKHLIRNLDLLAQLPEVFDLDAVQYAMCILARLGADSLVAQLDVEVQVALQRAFTALSERLDDAAAPHLVLRDISKTLFDACKFAPIQERLVSMLPASTPRLALFRRRLALAFFLEIPDPLSADLHANPQAAAISKAIVDRLESDPVFGLDDDTDFAEITAMISILDIGIGPGFWNAPDLLTKPLPAAVTSAKVSRFSRVSKELPSDPVTLAQTAYNAAVNRLSDALTKIVSCIHDRGASHMGRTETKGVLERVIQRLDMSVRCWPRKRGGRGAWMFDLPPTDRYAPNIPRGLDGFIKIEKREDIDDDHLDDVKKAVKAESLGTGCSNVTAAFSSGEDEFEARVGIKA